MRYLADDTSHDGIVMNYTADLEESLADLIEARFTIEPDCIEVLVVDTKQKPFASDLFRGLNGLLHKCASNAASLKTTKKVDAFQLIV